MIKQAQERQSWHLGEYDRVLMIAAHYGFVPMKAPSVTPADTEITSDCDPHPHYNAAEKAAFLRTYMAHGLAKESHPLQLSYRIPSKTARNYALELVGFSAGVAEALLIRSSLSILLDSGYKHLSVDINCIGDKESMSSYERELQNFIKRSALNLPAELKQDLKKDIFNLIKVSSPEIDAVRHTVPPSISFLSAPSRAYFKEVLEYVEALDIEFRLAPELIGNKNYCSHTVFAIRNNDGENNHVLAVGYCYSRLSKRFGFKKELPLAGVTIFSESSANKKKVLTSKTYKAMPKSKFYLVQLGREAKMKSLNVIELLRKERIPVYHYLGKDKIASQFATAETLRVPYLIIIGQKEALDGSVIVRNINSRAQETVYVRDLPQFLRTIPI